jgi:hypothetical protein
MAPASSAGSTGMIAGGDTGSPSNATEEFTESTEFVNAKQLTTSTS